MKTVAASLASGVLVIAACGSSPGLPPRSDVAGHRDLIGNTYRFAVVEYGGLTYHVPARVGAQISDVQHRVHHRAQVVSVLAALLAGRVEHRLQQRPLLTRQITGTCHAGHRDDQRHSGNRDTPSKRRRQ